MAPIDAEHLDAFVTFAEHLNFTRAARAHGVSQPALHGQVQKLAEALGVALYVKRGGKLALTPDGERVLGFGRDARERTRVLRAELSHREVLGPLSLCAGEGSYLHLLGEAIARAAREGLDLRLLVRDREGTALAVRTGEAHLGVAPLPLPPAGLVTEPITEVGQMAVFPAAHPLAARKELRLVDLAGEPLLLPPPDRPHRVMVEQALRAAGVEARVAVGATGWDLLIRFAELGLGIAVVNAFCRVPEGLVVRPIPELPSRAYHLIRRTEAAREGATAALARAIRATANGWRKRSGLA